MEERTVFQPRVFGSVKPGTRLNGIYEIEKMIAQGGMGEVYRGFNIQTGDIVAIKMIRPEFSTNEEVMELFRREASILHNLVHEAIVRYFLFSVDPVIGRAYLAMEYVDGPSLSDRLTSGPLPLPDVTILRKRIASALETAHRLGVVHRDISSDNIILPSADVRNAKIIDFGIARAAQMGKKTIIGSGFAGKYNYVSPEQLGLAGGDVTFKSDIYSLGLVLAEAARGHTLDMSGSQADVIDKRRVVPDLSDVDPSLRPLLQSMLQPLPENRPASMAAIAEWTEQTAPAPSARRKTVREPALRPAGTAEQPRESSGGRVATIFGAVIAVASLGGVAFVFKDDLSQWTRGSGGTGASSAPTASATPPLPPLPSKPPADASRPAAEAPAESAKLPPLAAPSAPQTPPPAPASPAAPSPPEAQQTASLPPSETPSSAAQPPAAVANPPAAVVAPPAAVVAPPAPHVPTAAEVLKEAPPRAPQAAIDLPSATVGAPYRAELPGFTDHGGKELRLSAESVPDGLSFRDLGEGKGLFEGSPAHAGRTTVRVEAVNANGKTAQMMATLVIADKPLPPPAEKQPATAPAAQPSTHNDEQTARLEAPRPSLPVASLEPATVGQDYSADLPPFSGGASATPMTLRADPPPPAGLVFADLGSGYSQISGKPTTAGSYAFDVVASNAAGLAGRMSVKLNVSPAAANVTAKAETPPPPVETPPAPDRAAEFVQSFDGGDCFLIKALPSAAGGHAYLGVGDQLGPFERFEESFRKEVGAEPQLSLRLIVPPECAALDVLRPASGDAASAPRITLSDYRVGRNKPLSGTVANLGGRRLYLLLVDNQGKAYRIDAKLQPGGDAATFSVPLVPDAGSVGPIQLVMAVTSAKPIPGLERFRSGELKGITPGLADEAKNGAATVGADFFMFVN
ncbi:serine/threonine-protein kinase [Roseiarcus sp.]|uniref:serine/threonine-protein kinase n=1 Tax=Roseiarcus sp. TaxID=1969460 RepID=UPI003F9BA537